jgi:hypothetical protein
VKVSGGGKLSSNYAQRLDAGIASKDTISVTIASTFKDPQTGETKSVDRDAGGGVTVGRPNGGDQSVTISGQELRD